MNVFEGKVWKYGSAALYIGMVFLSFYCACYRTPVGLKYAVNLAITGWAVVAFVVRPQFERVKFCLRFFLLFFFPYMLFWTWSVGIWISEFQTLDYVIRGSKNIMYMLTNILYVCSAIYLFDLDAIPYTLASMTLANGLVMLEVMRSSGPAELISEYLRLLITFADDTGGVMAELELHDMVFGWGVFLIYFAIHRERDRRLRIWGLGLCFFFFTLALKRIAVPAVVAAIFLYFLLRHRRPRFLKAVVWLSAIVTILGILGYLSIIKSGLFFQLAEEYGIDLMSRDRLYSYYEDFYDVVPTYLGRGIRFIYTYGTEHSEGMDIPIEAIHNVYLELFIEVGFACWVTWLFYELIFRIDWIADRYTWDAALVVVPMNLYVFFTYLTDNTSFYFPINVTYRLAIMAWVYEIMEQKNIPYKGQPGRFFRMIVQ